MKAYLLNAQTRLTTEVQYSNLHDIYRLCGFKYFACVSLADGDELYVDGGALRPGLNQRYYIGLRRAHGFGGQAFAGNGLIVGHKNGECVAPKMPLTFYEEQLFWVEHLPRSRWWSFQDAHCRNLNIVSYGELIEFLRAPVKELVK